MPSNAVRPQDVMLGKGKIFVALYDDDETTLLGERFLGNCDQFGRQFTDQRAQMYDSTDHEAGLMVDTLTRREGTMTTRFRELNKENVALAFMGDASTPFTQSASSATDIAIANVQQGYWYDLGFRDVSAVVVADSVPNTYVVGDDYLVDAETGRIFIVPGGGIANDTDLLVDCDYAAVTLPKVILATKSNIFCRVHFIGDPAQGPRKEVYLWRVSINPQSVLDYIGEDFAGGDLQGRILKDGEAHPTEPYGVEYDLD